MVFGIPLLGFVIPYVFFHLSPFDEQIPIGYFVGSCIQTCLYWIVCRYIHIFYRKKWPSISDFKTRLTATGLSILIYSTCFCFSITFFIKKEMIPSIKGLTALDYNIPSLTAALVIGAIYETIYILFQLKHVMVEREILKKENLQSQLETLKNQVNPHFLFNSLNTLASVIPEDPKMAVDFVQNLSAVYRYILEIRSREFITIQEELKCIRAYEFLLKIRFGESLKLEIDINEIDLEKQIVPLSLQMLLENAIKHNVVSKKRPLEISISIIVDRILIVNNLQPKLEQEKSTKTGLENIRKRYQLLSGKSIEVIQGSDTFSVTLPLIEIEAYENIDH
tara:strand:- start:17994 stop:19001 length:1008 start_codon:yes stop_codon:yes gene_type:complete